MTKQTYTQYKNPYICPYHIVTRKREKNPIKINQFSNKRLGLLVLREWAKHSIIVVGLTCLIVLLKYNFIFYNNKNKGDLQVNNCYYYKEVDKIISH